MVQFLWLFLLLVNAVISAFAPISVFSQFRDFHFMMENLKRVTEYLPRDSFLTVSIITNP